MNHRLFHSSCIMDELVTTGYGNDIIDLLYTAKTNTYSIFKHQLLIYYEYLSFYMCKYNQSKKKSASQRSMPILDHNRRWSNFFKPIAPVPVNLLYIDCGSRLFHNRRLIEGGNFKMCT